MPMSIDFDVTIIGAGAVGLAVARNLAIHGKRVLLLESNNSIGTPPLAASHFYYTKDDSLCIGQPHKIDKILGVQHYIAAWPKIPVGTSCFECECTTSTSCEYALASTLTKGAQT